MLTSKRRGLHLHSFLRNWECGMALLNINMKNPKCLHHRFTPTPTPLVKILPTTNILSLKGCLGRDHYETILNTRSILGPFHSHFLHNHAHHNHNAAAPAPSPSTLINGNDGSSVDRSATSRKLVVAVDVDEVLGSFVAALNQFIAHRYSLNHSLSEYHVYEFFKIWNCSRDEADIRVHEFFKTPYFTSGIRPIPGARNALDKLSQFCDLSVVTSRQNAIKDHTIEWIEKHYPGVFQEIHFGNHFALDGTSRPKSDICRSLGAEVLIDDNPRYALECAAVGIKVLLFDYENSYPWCKTGSSHLHPLVTKVHNWDEVERLLVSWVIS